MSRARPPLRHVADVLLAPGVRHGFFGRKGGASLGDFASLNGAYGEDDPAAVSANRAAAADALGADALVSVRQVHGVRALAATRRWSPDDAPEADALVTTQPGLAIAVLTADCAPILLSDPTANVVAAAHAGWRGATAGVIESTLEAMEAAGAVRARIAAAVGPCIAPPSYEVRADFRDAAAAADIETLGFLWETDAGMRFDLPGYAVHRLARAGVRRVEALAIDVRAHHSAWFSRRAALARGFTHYGANIAAIARTP